MHKLWTLLLLIPAFAGCLGSDDEPDDHDDDGMGHDAMDGMDHNGTMDGMDGNGTANVTNAAPTVALTTNNTAIEVPADVNLTIEATDADGDDLTFTLDADGDGTADSEGTLVADGNGTYAPFTFTFSYTSNGTYNATVEVSDGTEAANFTLVLTATEGVLEDGDGLCHADPAGYTTILPAGVAILYVFEDFIYMESNDVDGLQYSGEGSLSTGFVHMEECVGGDTLIY